MKYPYYEMSVPVFVTALKNLKGILKKGEAYAKTKKVPDDVVFGDRIVFDMFPFVRQVQTACDNAKGTCARLAKVAIPKMEDNEKTFAELQARIDKTLTFIESLKPEQFEGGADIKAEFPYFPGKHILGKDYLPKYAIPNFFFHLTTAYNILRKNGVDIGKSDYITGSIFRDN